METFLYTMLIISFTILFIILICLTYDIIKNNKPKNKKRDYEKEIHQLECDTSYWYHQYESLQRDYDLLEDERSYHLREKLNLKAKNNTLSKNNESLQMIVEGLNSNKMYDNYMLEKKKHRITKCELNVLKQKIEKLYKEMEK